MLSLPERSVLNPSVMNLPLVQQHTLPCCSVCLHCHMCFVLIHVLFPPMSCPLCIFCSVYVQFPLFCHYRVLCIVFIDPDSDLASFSVFCLCLLSDILSVDHLNCACLLILSIA